jgi:hypothetical protein
LIPETKFLGWPSHEQLSPTTRPHPMKQNMEQVRIWTWAPAKPLKAWRCCLCLLSNCYLLQSCEYDFYSFVIFFSFLVGLGFELRLHTCKSLLYHLNHTSISSCSCYFGDGDSWRICLGWPRTEIFLISTSQVARIAAVNHGHLVSFVTFYHLRTYTIVVSCEMYIYKYLCVSSRVNMSMLLFC